MKAIEKIDKLHEVMAKNQIDLYIVPSVDFHQSEWVGGYFKSIEYLTGFSSTAATLVVTKNEAKVWTDGRFFIQAEQQLAGSGVELMKMGEPDVPTVMEFVAKALPEGGTIGFDGRTISISDGEIYEKIAERKHGKIVYEIDLVGQIWQERPTLPKNPVFALGVEYVGEDTDSKLKRVRESLKQAGATVQILSKLEDICWILNIRESNYEYFPLILSYAIITMSHMHLYMDADKLDDEIKAKLDMDGVVLHPYNDVYEAIKQLSPEEVAMIDPALSNYSLYKNIPDNVEKKLQQNPEVYFRAIKNSVEMENLRKAGLLDSVAHVRFMKWLKENVGKIRITELSAAAKIDAYRQEMEGFIQTYIEPISAFGEHGAIIHYAGSEESDIELEEGSFYLYDSGAAFNTGVTDITRTYSFGEITQKMKDHFTLVAIGNLKLSNVKFRKGIGGINLDVMARQALWEHGLDYNHGTGHGIGYVLNVHEGPGSTSWRPNVNSTQPFEVGMMLSDEPGVYIEGQYGIRLENDLLVVEDEKTEFGQFLRFEILNYIPFDLDAINPELMSKKEKELLNSYHATVYEKVSPYLNNEEKEFLKKYTREI